LRASNSWLEHDMQHLQRKDEHLGAKGSEATNGERERAHESRADDLHMCNKRIVLLDNGINRSNESNTAGFPLGLW
jgi:hypothetical protein